jgi:prepilin-type N-terminal cleavage/methylation domain-containing protein
MQKGFTLIELIVVIVILASWRRQRFPFIDLALKHGGRNKGMAERASAYFVNSRCAAKTTLKSLTSASQSITVMTPVPSCRGGDLWLRVRQPRLLAMVRTGARWWRWLHADGWWGIGAGSNAATQKRRFLLSLGLSLAGSFQCGPALCEPAESCRVALFAFGGLR